MLCFLSFHWCLQAAVISHFQCKSFFQVFYFLRYQVVKLVTAILNEVLLVHLHDNHVKVLSDFCVGIFFLILSSLLLSFSDLRLSLLFWLPLDITHWLLLQRATLQTNCFFIGSIKLSESESHICCDGSHGTKEKKAFLKIVKLEKRHCGNPV